jgi:hypothetical protein
MRALLTAMTLMPLLSACATGPDRRAVLDGVVGKSETDAVRVLGVPDRTFDTNGRRFLAFVDRRSEAYGGGVGIFGSYGYGSGGPGILAFDPGPAVYQKLCETTLEVAEGRIASYALRGNACF